MSGFEPQVSVVTPFHDTAEHLAECIDSVLRQTRGDFEYVLVDNASTDGSERIAASLAARDSRIRLYRFDALIPQVPNYNRALELISDRTRFVKIVQADDWLFPECLERMTAVAESNPRIGIVASYVLRGQEVVGLGLPLDRATFDGREVGRQQLLEGRFYFGTPSSVMFRGDVVRARRPFYREGRLHEDTEACYEILRDHDFGFVHQILSYWRVDDASISGRVKDFHPNFLDKRIVLEAFGRDFLEAAQYRACVDRTERAYYRMLGKQAVRGAGAGFWKYHREGLATEGLEISKLRVLGGALREFLDLALNPKRTLETAVRTVLGRD